MTKTVIALGAVVVVGMGTVACGGGDSGGGGGTAGQQTADQKQQQSTNGTEPTASCSIEKGAKGNDKGVGAFCDSSTKCASGMLCTGDFGETPSFCTILCNADADCGSGATCYHDPRGSACVPTACLGNK